METDTDSIGDYLILDTLGQGGMGVVYRARHRITGQDVALKTVLHLDEFQCEGIRREIRGLARLRHAGIIRILDEGIIHGMPWYAMELLQGRTLRQTMTEWRNQYNQQHASSSRDVTGRVSGSAHPDATLRVGWSPGPLLNGDNAKTGNTSERVDAISSSLPGESVRPSLPEDGPTHMTSGLRIIRKVCSALAYLHGEAIVHRDLKPDNIFLVPGEEPVIVDFGLMRQFREEISRDSLSTDDSMQGTVLYMAPEQITGSLVDARTDLYAIGCMLYEIIVGHPPFFSRQASVVLRAHLQSDPVPPIRFVPDLPADLNELVIRLLEKDPRNRLGYADTLASLLGRIIGESEAEASSARSRPYLYRSRCVGREQQVSTLEKALSRLSEGHGGLVCIRGESGVGKTRLVSETGNNALRRDVTVFVGECLEEKKLPLSALQNSLAIITRHCLSKGREETDRILGSAGKILMHYHPRIRDLPGQEEFEDPPELPWEHAGPRLYRCLVQTYMAFTGNKPLLLLIDDLQWADELLLEFINFMRENDFCESPLLILTTMRGEEMVTSLRDITGSMNECIIDLLPLDETAIGEVIGDMLALPVVPQPFTGFINRHSEGNPFFVAEFLRVAVDEGLLWRDADGNWLVGTGTHRALTEDDYEDLPLPHSIQHLMTRRFEGLPRDVLAFVTAAAILGSEPRLDVLESMLEWSRLSSLDAVDLLEKKQILEKVSAVSLRFVHRRFCESALSQLSTETRKDLHRRAAQSIESLFHPDVSDHAADLGYHWEAADDKDKAFLYYKQAALYAHDHFAFREAARLYLAAMNMLDSGDVGRIQLGHALGEAYYQSGNYQKSIGVFEECLAFSQNLHGAEHALVATALNNLGMVHSMIGDYRKAVEFHEKAIVLQERLLGKKHTDTADSYNNLGLVLMNLGEYARAFEYQCTCLEIRRELLGEKHKDTAQSFNNAGVACVHLGDYPQALEHLTRSLAIKRHVLNDKHPDMTETLNNLGGIHRIRGEYDAALDLYQQCLAIQLEVTGWRHPFTGLSYNNIGDCYLRKGMVDKALENFQEAFRIHLAVVGDTHMYTAMALNGLGQAFHLKQDDEKALDNFEKSYTILHALFGERHPYVVKLLQNRAISLLARRQYQAAIADLTRAVHLCQQLQGEKNPALVELRLLMGKASLQIACPDEAHEHLTAAKVMGVQFLGPDHPTILDADIHLGHACVTLGRKEEAQQYYSQALETAGRMKNEDMKNIVLKALSDLSD